MTAETGPLGIGDFTGSPPPGAGTDAPHTDSQFDIMLTPTADFSSVNPNTVIRFRLKGFNHHTNSHLGRDQIDGVGVMAVSAA